MRIEREHTAALIVDFQERLVPAIADHEGIDGARADSASGLKSIRDSDDCNTAVYKGLGMSQRSLEASERQNIWIRFFLEVAQSRRFWR